MPPEQNWGGRFAEGEIDFYVVPTSGGETEPGAVGEVARGRGNAQGDRTGIGDFENVATDGAQITSEAGLNILASGSETTQQEILLARGVTAVAVRCPCDRHIG